MRHRNVAAHDEASFSLDRRTSLGLRDSLCSLIQQQCLVKGREYLQAHRQRCRFVDPANHSLVNEHARASEYSKEMVGDTSKTRRRDAHDEEGTL